MKKLGLSILYTDIGKEKKEWKQIKKDNDKVKYLREQYWANLAKTKGSHLYYPISRNSIDIPGDNFIYQNSFGLDNKKGGLKWFEITEVFESENNAKEITEAMKEWNNINNLKKEKFKKLVSSIDMGCPSKYRQKYVADKVFESIDRKVKKTSYNNIVNNFGKGHLVVGLPLWFATPPVKVMKVKNAPDDFMMRVQHRLLEIKNQILKKEGCPFYKITVIWDVSVKAMEEWLEKREMKNTGKHYIEILRLLENNMKEEDNPSVPLKISIDLEEEKQPNDWLKNLKIISQNSDAELVFALEEKF